VARPLAWSTTQCHGCSIRPNLVFSAYTFLNLNNTTGFLLQLNTVFVLKTSATCYLHIKCMTQCSATCRYKKANDPDFSNCHRNLELKPYSRQMYMCLISMRLHAVYNNNLSITLSKFHCNSSFYSMKQLKHVTQT